VTRQDRCELLRHAAVAAVFMMAAGAAAASDSPPASDTAPATPPPLELIVSLADQRIDVYRGLELIDSGPVSSGMKGRETPAGIYAVLQKRKWHRSNLYSAAPMPHMQRITWSGIALHAGHLPGYPASHGCIRLEREFARKLFRLARVGTDVIVAPREARPRPIAHHLLDSLSGPADRAQTQVAGLGPIGDVGATDAAPTAGADSGPGAGRERAQKPGSPLRVLITWRNGRERMMDVQSLLADLGYAPGEIDGHMGPATSRAIQAFQNGAGLRPTGAASEVLVDALYQAAGRDRLDAHLYVRRDHRELFDVPVLIDGPAMPLGTHMLTTHPQAADSHGTSWTAISLGGDAAPAAEAALGRVTLSAATRRRLSALLTPGSTIIIADQGLGRETGSGTDFIIQPR
jgi:peptidoglycan hydrolase-like protein with peptidoglycan-binding domain